MSDVRRQAHRVLMPSFHGTGLPDWMRDRLREGVGSVCLFGTNLTGDDSQARALVADIRAGSPEGVLVTLDEEGGDVTRLDARRGGSTAGHAVLGAVDDVSLTRAVALSIGNRLRDIGIDLDLGPVADVNCEPDNPVIGVRSFGASPELVARHVVAFDEGLHAAGVAACVKHFPGHGATVTDSHLALPRLDIPLSTARERELVPFVAAVRAGVPAVMTSHVVLAALDADNPATTSPSVLGLLRRELGFEGVIVTDALDMAGVAGPYGGSGRAAVAALAAGADLLCVGPERAPGEMEPVLAWMVDDVVAAVSDGRLPAGRLADAAARVDALVDAVRSGSLPMTVPPASVPSSAEVPSGYPHLEAARRAVTVRGPLAPDGPKDALVLEFHVTPGIAAGEVPWTLPLGLLDGAGKRSLSPTDELDAALAEVGERPLVALVRDAHRHTWVADRLDRIARVRPDLITIETGWPVADGEGSPTALPGATTIWTYGGSSVSLRAAAEVLAGAVVPGRTVVPGQPVAPGPRSVAGPGGSSGDGSGDGSVPGSAR
ncbi:glycoside hydrolase family 3 N-terminal domain-containing protein [Kineosporia succinea]|uniref:Beta-N-acetylhexosaminidase n=1 Tax=Kineosporia succinea TaxID=84632 RepID=A0ABT9P6E1_9ACTN|nr:glycoside hydrolase family 3 N-terminal domain-containing protein [Kineosporia succinea]MDP9828121.1 beta-N-acetylhexosaminidase [Kineosporia succinea]